MGIVQTPPICVGSPAVPWAGARTFGVGNSTLILMAVFMDAQAYFNTAWSNLNGRKMSVDYRQYADDSKSKYWLYRFMEWSGLATF